MVTTPPSILVIGYRKGLVDALKSMGFSFAVWSNKALTAKKLSYPIICEPFPTKARGIKQVLQRHFPNRSFDYVIAGTEAGVFPVAVARKHFTAGAESIRDSLRCHDKIMMKRFLHRRGIPMTEFMASQKAAKSEFQDLHHWGWPIVSKERRESGGRGFHLIYSEEEMSVLTRGTEDRILERFIDGSEISVECFIKDSQIQFANITDYYVKKHVNLVPAVLTNELHNDVLELSTQVVHSLGIPNGMVHIEVYLTPEGILFGEVARRPPGGYIMELMQLAYGFNPWEAYVAMSCEREFHFPLKAKSYTAGIVLHPGSGSIESISGIQQIAKHPNTVKYKIKAQEGDWVQFRQGTGEDLGYILLSARTPQELIRAVDFARSSLNFRMRSPA